MCKWSLSEGCVREVPVAGVFTTADGVVRREGGGSDGGGGGDAADDADGASFLTGETSLSVAETFFSET